MIRQYFKSFVLLFLFAAMYGPAFAQSDAKKEQGEEIKPIVVEDLSLKTNQEPVEGVDLAYGAYQRGYYLTAFELALPRAEAGDAAAQTLIAELYEHGRGVARNTKEAANWYGIAAESGNREAMFSYALKLIEGKDVARDLDRGFAMMEKAASQGHPVAMFNHAQNIVKNRPTSAGYRKALPFYEKAAESRLADASFALYKIYAGGLTNGIQYPDKAVKWLLRAAKSGIVEAQLEYGILLARGEWVEQDLRGATGWFQVAAHSGNVIAQNRLAHAYAAGSGVEQSKLEAARWHIIASRAGRNDPQLDTLVKSLDEDTRTTALTLANRWPSGS